MHIACLAVFLPWIELTWTAAALLVAFYSIRVFGLTAGYHRYFAHRAYKTSRVGQFILAFMGCSAMQRGPLWWAGHHRHHHRHSDMEDDVHSPILRSFWYSHVGWIFDDRWSETPFDQIHDFAKYPELRFLEKHHWFPGICVAVLCLLIGGWSGLVWGFFVSTVAVYHVTFVINSLCHVWGRRYYPTTDYSKNNLILALLTFGEGWHNNHHHYQSSANQGFFWWEIDISYSVLWLLDKVGVVWDLRTPPLEKRVRSTEPIPTPPQVEMALSRQREAEGTLHPMATQAMTAAAQAVAPVFSAAQAVAAPVMAAAHVAGERVAAAAYAAQERVSAAALAAGESMKAAGESVKAAAHSASESVSGAAHAAHGQLSAMAQAASDSMKAAAHAASETVSAAAQAASPAVVSAAQVAVPLVIVVSFMSQS